jgi:CheY-like chemotaxis protein
MAPCKCDCLQFARRCSILVAMSKPLALVYYLNLMPGSQLAGRLQDLGYRVQTVSGAALLPAACESEMPLVLIAELAPPSEACAAIARVRANPATQHIPVLGFTRTHDAASQNQARSAGVTLLAAGAGIAEQLPQLLNQILQVE